MQLNLHALPYARLKNDADTLELVLGNRSTDRCKHAVIFSMLDWSRQIQYR